MTMATSTVLCLQRLHLADGWREARSIAAPIGIKQPIPKKQALLINGYKWQLCMPKIESRFIAMASSTHRIQSPNSIGILPDSVVLIGPRHQGKEDIFAGQIDDARIYAQALGQEEIAALLPNVEGSRRPWAWWTFDGEQVQERTGRIRHSRMTIRCRDSRWQAPSRWHGWFLYFVRRIQSPTSRGQTDNACVARSTDRGHAVKYSS
jgi:hypothetical protein